MTGKGMPILLRKLKTVRGLSYDVSVFKTVAVIAVLASRKVMYPSVAFKKRYQLMLQSISALVSFLQALDDHTLVALDGLSSGSNGTCLGDDCQNFVLPRHTV